MPITTILFDGGGVIVDETAIEQEIAKIISGILCRFDPAYSIEQYWRDTEEAVFRFAPSTYRYVMWKNTQDITTFERLCAVYQDLVWERRPPLKLTDGIAQELRKLHEHFRFGIAGQYGVEILETLRHDDLLGLFDNKITQDDFRITKPDPRYFEQIATACGVAPAGCLMVGDRIDNDVIPARQVGMLSVRFRTGVHCRQEPRTPSEMPDAEITSISQLAETIFRLTAKQ
jgi:putative hydrolase of the HAD superfamily